MNWFNNFFGKVFKGSLEDSPKESQVNASPESMLSPNPQINTNLVDEEYLLELEERLIGLDCGIEFAEFVTKKIRDKNGIKVFEAENLVRELCIEVLTKANPVLNSADSFSPAEKTLEIILIVGVNGAGKTTSIGKLANAFYKQNKKVLIAPCDTFRAAAPEQLMMWAERSKADFYQSPTAKKADAILFEAIQKAKSENYNVLMVDTAGRLQNKKSLMEELSKLSSVIDKHAKSFAEFSRFLVLDSTTGQNGYQQALLFNEATKLDGIILTKFDGSGKGGIVFAISYNLNLPIKYIGTGEKIEDLSKFNIKEFISEVFK